MITRAEALRLSHIHYISLPDGIRGAVKQIKGGRYLIAIDSSMSADEQARTLEHELAHIRLNHFHSELDIQAVEAQAEKLTREEAIRC